MEKTPIYSPRQVMSGSFLGGPIAMVYFLRSNFKTLGNSAAATKALVWGILFNVALIIALPFEPAHFPNQAVPLAYIFAAQYIAESKQLKKQAISSSDQFCFQSNWKVFGRGVAFLIGTLLLCVLIIPSLVYFSVIKLD
jgi:hypothetical protein